MLDQFTWDLVLRKLRGYQSNVSPHPVVGRLVEIGRKGGFGECLSLIDVTGMEFLYCQFRGYLSWQRNVLKG